jgi:hypothetical protein
LILSKPIHSAGLTGSVIGYLNSSDGLVSKCLHQSNHKSISKPSIDSGVLRLLILSRIINLFNVVDVNTLIVEDELSDTISLSCQIDHVVTNKTVLIKVNVDAQVEMSGQHLIAVGVAVWIPDTLGRLIPESTGIRQWCQLKLFFFLQELNQ